MLLAATVLASTEEISDPHSKHEKPQNSHQLAWAPLIRMAAGIIRPGIGDGSSFAGQYNDRGIIGRYWWHSFQFKHLNQEQSL